MITEIVTFKIEADLARADVEALYEKSAHAWRENDDLVHRSFLFDPERGLGVGVYLRTSPEHARTADGPAFAETNQSVFGGTPEFSCFESPTVIKNHPRGKAGHRAAAEHSTTEEMS